MTPTETYLAAGSAAAGGPAEASDDDLFDAAKRGNFAAFETVVRRHHPRIYRVAYGMTQSANDAEEVVQDTFLRVFRGLEGFRRQSSPSTWIYQIAVNTALMRMRQRRRKPLLSLGDYPHLEDQSHEPLLGTPGRWARSPDKSLLDQELAVSIETAIEALPDKYRMVIVLRDVEGQSAEEVAQTLGLTIPTVKARLHRARLCVRRALHHYFKQ
jgi:RNA polymerase sigma-70 factor (ECF subfamily)